MPWFKVDDKLHSHPKTHLAGIRPMGLWLLAGSWSSDQLTDGFVPRQIIASFGARPADARALTEAGLWVEEDGGWRFHDWADQNPSRADVLARREVERQRKAEARARKAELRVVRHGDK